MSVNFKKQSQKEQQNSEAKLPEKPGRQILDISFCWSMWLNNYSALYLFCREKLLCIMPAKQIQII